MRYNGSGTYTHMSLSGEAGIALPASQRVYYKDGRSNFGE